MDYNSEAYALEKMKARKEIAVAVIQSYKFSENFCNGMPRYPKQDTQYLSQVIRELQNLAIEF